MQMMMMPSQQPPAADDDGRNSHKLNTNTNLNLNMDISNASGTYGMGGMHMNSDMGMNMSGMNMGSMDMSMNSSAGPGQQLPTMAMGGNNFGTNDGSSATAMAAAAGAPATNVPMPMPAAAAASVLPSVQSERQIIERCLNSMACAITHNPQSGKLEEPNGLQSGQQLATLMSPASLVGGGGSGNKCWSFPCYSLKHHQSTQAARDAAGPGDRSSLERVAAGSLAQPMYASLMELSMIPKFITVNIEETFRSLLHSRLRSYATVLAKQQQQASTASEKQILKQILQFLMASMKNLKQAASSSASASASSSSNKFLQPTTIVNRYHLAPDTANSGNNSIMSIPGQGFMANITQQTTLDLQLFAGNGNNASNDNSSNSNNNTASIQVQTTGNLFGYWDSSSSTNANANNPQQLSQVSFTMNMEQYLYQTSQQIKIIVRSAVRNVLQMHVANSNATTATTMMPTMMHMSMNAQQQQQMEHQQQQQRQRQQQIQQDEQQRQRQIQQRMQRSQQQQRMQGQPPIVTHPQPPAPIVSPRTPIMMPPKTAAPSSTAPIEAGVSNNTAANSQRMTHAVNSTTITATSNNNRNIHNDPTTNNNESHSSFDFSLTDIDIDAATNEFDFAEI